MVDHAYVTAAEDISSSSVFLNRKRDIGTFFFNDGISPSARLGTGAAIGTPAGEIIRQKTSPGI